MGFGGISIWQLLIVLAIVILIFGTKRLKGLGGDIGSSIKSFKKAMNEDDKAEEGKEEERKDKADEQTASLERKDADFPESEEKTRKKTDKSAH